MKTLTKQPLLAYVSAGSFICLLGMGLFTNPVSDVLFSLLFFFVLFIFLYSFGLLLIRRKTGGRSATISPRLLIFSVFLVIAGMFRSAHSLSLIDLLILILSAGGVMFYLDRRR